MSLSLTQFFARLSLIVFITFASCTGSIAATDKPVITLDPSSGQSPSVESVSFGKTPLQYPANFRHLGDLAVGQVANVEPLTLRFSAETKLLTISSTPDFVVEEGGSCVVGNSYRAGDTCRLLVRFTPQGPGRRLGKLTITHSASATPAYVGLGGNSYAPVVSFIPALMSTLPGSAPNGVGLLNGAKNLAIDGGDTLYVADTGNNIVRVYDSGGAFKTIASSGITAPVGIAADNFGEVYFSEPASNLVYEIFEYGSVLQLNGSGTDACTVASTCSMTSEKVYTPGQMGIDSSNQLFFEDGNRGAAVAVVQPYPATLARLYDPFTYQTTSTGVFTVDNYDNLYTVWSITGLCQINQQTYSDAANSRAVYRKIVGGKFCGFAGDGGQARNAEIGATIGQMAFDIAGNMYFTDASNQRVRRIDYATGIIHTIAGNGNVGNTGDSNQSLSATFNSPTGIGVDSQGQVYIINKTSTSGTNQAIRRIGLTGMLPYGSIAKGATFSKYANIMNSGNSALNVTKAVITGPNAADFTFDSNTTTCTFFGTNPSLANGQSCNLGVVFKPSAAGARSATLTLLDNTVTGSNTILLSGTGTLPAPTVKITAPAPGATFTSGATVKFTATVTSTGTAPTGNVTFKVDGHAFGNPVTLASGSASVNLTGLTVTTHSLSATYNGDANYAATTVSESIVVKAAAVVSHPIERPTLP